MRANKTAQDYRFLLCLDLHGLNGWAEFPGYCEYPGSHLGRGVVFSKEMDDSTKPNDMKLKSPEHI